MVCAGSNLRVGSDSRCNLCDVCVAGWLLVGCAILQACWIVCSTTPMSSTPPFKSKPAWTLFRRKCLPRSFAFTTR